MASTARSAAAPNAQNKPVRKKTEPKPPKNPDRIKWLDFSGRVDIPMLLITLVLLGFGITMMFSAGHALSMRDNDDSYAYAKKQMMAAGVGLIIMTVASAFDYRRLRKPFKLKFFGLTITWAHVALVLTLFLTALVIPLGVSNTVGGPCRWLRVPVFGTFQPSDFLKVGLIIFMAYYIHKYSDRMRLFRYGMLRPLILFVIVALLMIAQPHLSGLLIMTAVCGCMLLVGGINVKPLIFVLAGVAALLGVMLLFSDFTYFKDRIMYTFDPEADILEKTYQSYQSVLAIGSGGVWG
ncbi:MAG: FtsW/RodA/SpoVE family cell cycle protein, partial [Oscillospiraceae bacterium]